VLPGSNPVTGIPLERFSPVILLFPIRLYRVGGRGRCFGCLVVTDDDLAQHSQTPGLSLTGP
jgi:hypothetical protein